VSYKKKRVGKDVKAIASSRLFNRGESLKVVLWQGERVNNYYLRIRVEKGKLQIKGFGRRSGVSRSGQAKGVVAEESSGEKWREAQKSWNKGSRERKKKLEG